MSSLRASAFSASLWPPPRSSEVQASLPADFTVGCRSFSSILTKELSYGVVCTLTSSSPPFLPERQQQCLASSWSRGSWRKLKARKLLCLGMRLQRIPGRKRPNIWALSRPHCQMRARGHFHFSWLHSADLAWKRLSPMHTITTVSRAL